MQGFYKKSRQKLALESWFNE